jgi:DNA-binding NtrC family response regulator
MNKILVVDDERPVRFALTEILKKSAYATTEAENGTQALEKIRTSIPDLVILDVAMPGLNGIDTLKEIRKINGDLPVIIVTGHGDIATAVQAIKLGAYDFLTKPPQIDRLLVTIQRALERTELQRSIRRLDLSMDSSLEWVFGKSPSIKGVIQQIRQVSWSDFSIIIQGETGTGKSVAAQTIHNLSKRAGEPFQVVDIGVIPETLMESELFGHEKGAFTGADKRKQGLFEAANKGTIFIDELENLPLALQGKLLRAVEEKKVYALGSTKPVAVDVRIIAATNRDLKTLVKERRFREDLFYRLSEFIIDLPPLRERTEDIPFFSAKFLLKASLELNKASSEIDKETIDLLIRYPWPGNIRELKNVIRRAALMSENGTIRKSHLEFLIEDKWDDKGDLPFLPLKEVSAIAAKDAEKQAIKRALALTKGNKSKAASMLEVDYKTLLTKIKEYLPDV